MADDLLTFELSGDDGSIEIHGDPAGLQRLGETLQRLASSPRSNHDHLATPAWAGDELSGENQGGKIVNQVTIHCWVPEHGDNS